MKTELWQHQKDAVAFASNKPGVLLGHDMATGKTATAIAICEKEQATRVLVMCPLSVVGVWPSQVARHSSMAYRVIRLDKGTVARKADSAWAGLRSPQPTIVVISHESAWREPFRSLALREKWDVIICDECFPAETPVLTPMGYVPIERLRVGDEVVGLDHETGQPMVTQVRHTFQRTYTGGLVQLPGAEATAGHPVWTERGYVQAKDISPIDSTCRITLNRLHGDLLIQVCMVRPPADEADLWRMAEPILREVVLGEVANVEAGVYRLTQHPEAAEVEPREHAPTSGSARRAGQAEGASSRADEPLPRSGRSSQGAPEPTRAGLSDAEWGKWTAAALASAPLGYKARLGYRSLDPYWFAVLFGLSDVLQTGYRPRRPEGSRRGGWGLASDEAHQGGGSQEGRVPLPDWMAGSPVHEQASPERPGGRGSGSDPSQLVYNLETGTRNYVVGDGLLVHNCHRAKAPGGKFSMFLGQLSKRPGIVRVGLTGTPMRHSPLDIYGAARFVDPSVFGRSNAVFRARYALMGGYQNHEVIGYQNMDELERKLATIMHRVKKEDVLDLPPEVDETRRCQLEPAARKVYRELKCQFVAGVEDGVITAANALTVLLRLQQIAGGTAKLEDGSEVVVSEAKRKLLEETLEDLQPTAERPVVVFCRFRADLRVVQDVASRFGVLGSGYGELSGSRKDGLSSDATIATGVCVLGVQIASGSVGVDLSRASTSIYYSMGFSLAELLQARARTHRPGQRFTTTHIALVAEDTVDETIIRALEARRDLIESVLEEVTKRQEGR